MNHIMGYIKALQAGDDPQQTYEDPYPFIYYYHRLSGEVISLVFFLVTYLLSWVLIFSRRSIPTLLYHCGLKSIVHHVYGRKRKSKQNSVQVDPPIVPFLVLYVNAYLFLRVITNIILGARDVLVLLWPTLFLRSGTSLWLFNIGNGMNLIIYTFAVSLYSCVVYMWVKMAVVIVKAKQTIWISLSIGFIILFGIISNFIALPLATLSFVNMRETRLGSIVLFITFPLGVILFTSVSLVAVISGLFVLGIIRKMGGRKLGGKEMTAFIKIGISIVAIIFANIVRCVGFVIYGAKIGSWHVASVWALLLRGIPDTVSCLMVILLFWPSNLICISPGAKEKKKKKKQFFSKLLEPSHFKLQNAPDDTSTSATIDNDTSSDDNDDGDNGNGGGGGGGDDDDDDDNDDNNRKNDLNQHGQCNDANGSINKNDVVIHGNDTENNGNHEMNDEKGLGGEEDIGGDCQKVDQVHHLNHDHETNSTTKGEK